MLSEAKTQGPMLFCFTEASNLNRLLCRYIHYTNSHNYRSEGGGLGLTAKLLFKEQEVSVWDGLKSGSLK